MRVRDTLGGYRSIDRFVEEKLKRFESMERGFRELCLLMFSERENIMFEYSHGYEIRKVSYGESLRIILSRAKKLKKALADFPQDSVIGLSVPNGLSWIELFWAILAAGYSPLLLNERLPDEALQDAIRSIGCKAVVSSGRSFPVPVLKAEELAAEEAAEEQERKDPELPENFGSTLYVMSSGTSAHVKVCGYTAEEFYYQIRGSFGIIQKSRGIKKHYEGALKQLLFLPLYHIFGLAAVYTWFAFFSRTFVELPDMAPKTILQTIRRHGVTHIFAVPMFFEKVYDEALRTIEERGEKTEKKLEKGLGIAKKLEKHPALHRLFGTIAFREVRENMFGKSIRYMITGGAPIREEVLSFFNTIGYHLSNGYGMTEIGITSVELSEDPKILGSASVGSPMDAVEYRISEDGELLVRGKVMAHSITVNGRTEERNAAEWFNTHDLAREENGRYYILGRQDDLIIGNSGENLNPVMIEPALKTEGVNEVCLTKEEIGGTRVPLLIASVPAETGAEKAKEIREALKSRLQELRLHTEIGKIVVTDVPLLSENDFKLNRRKISAAYKEGRFPEIGKEVKAEEGGDAVTEEIRAFFAETLRREKEEIGLDADFFSELGGSSLDYFGMMARIRDRYQVDFPYTSGTAFFTVRGIADFIREGQRK